MTKHTNIYIVWDDIKY